MLTSGPGGAGHFVKMTHNGIEYGDMELICEAYYLMRKLLGMSAAEIAEQFKAWNEGELSSYEVDITAHILTVKDPETGNALVDMIAPIAGSKGTGMWTVQEALSLGVPPAHHRPGGVCPGSVRQVRRTGRCQGALRL